MRIPRRDGTDRVPARTHESRPVTAPQGSKGGEASAPAAPPSPPPAPPATGSQVPPPGAPGPHRPSRGPGAGFGLALIVIGLVILATRLIPGLAWWSMWPLIIVGAGLFSAFTPGRDGWSVHRLFDGFSTVAIGLVLLAVSTGYVGFGVFWEIVRLWPVLVIALGLELLGKANRSSWIRAIGSVVVIAALAYAVAVSATGSPSLIVPERGSAAEASINEPVGRVREAELGLDAGAANVTLTGGGALVEATGSSQWGEPEFEVSRSGETAEVSLSLGLSEGTTVLVPGSPGAWLDARVSRSVLWDMKIDAGVTDLEANLSDVSVRSLDLKPGVAKVSMRLGRVPQGVEEATLSVDSGVSSVSVEIPEGVEARVMAGSGLTKHNIGGRFENVGGGAWETSGFESARDAGRGVWLITLKSGIGSVNIDTY